MIARIALLLALAAAIEIKTYDLEEVTEISIFHREKVKIEYTPKVKDEKRLWVIGRFPSAKIIPEEGRLGDRINEKFSSYGTLIQSWTIANVGGAPGEEFVMNFWYLNPQYAEMYYNDPEAYEEMFDEVVQTRDVRFILSDKDL